MTERDALVDTFMDRVRARNEGDEEFIRAVEDVAQNVLTIEKNHSGYAAARVLERLTVPDRLISFRVCWENDDGGIEINQGWRCQLSNAIGPYKGGIRFHPTVNPSILKFLAFEQTFKNALTGLPMGGAKGGSDFDPSGRSRNEIMRFCHAFMTELSRYIGPDRDVPAGDINVGTDEIGYLFGRYKSLEGQFHGALTGKGQAFGGSAMRVEATGFGLVYFVAAMLEKMDDSLEGKRVTISGKGNVATHAAEKAAAMGAKVVTLSDTSGTLVAEDGMSQEAIEWVRAQKAAGDDISSPPSGFGLSFEEGALPWGTEADIALPCATQNEMDEEAAQNAVDAGIMLLAEGANMPLTSGATAVIEKAGIPYSPGKASNAGGVAVSGLEMSQNAHGRFASSADIDAALKDIMQRIHQTIIDEAGSEPVHYRRHADIAAYRVVADAISAFGPV